jgi:isopentenyl diphosphate isomerase/L-lactate dehydrogenase-like FMN-dependent dehydrogenase
MTNRRAFLSYLAASPALTPASRAFAQLVGSGDVSLLDDAADAVNVFDFEPIARTNLTDAHFTYMAMGVDGGATLDANRKGFEHLQIRPRRLVDVSHIDMGIELFGTRHASPVIIAPCGTHKMFHPEGELAVARASATRNCLQILSTVTTTSVEDVNAARGAPVWYQLYPTEDWRITEALLRRAQDSGCPAVAITVDLPNSNREALDRFQRATNTECLACHEPGLKGSVARKPMFDGLDLSGISNTRAPQMNWEFVERVRNFTSMRVLLKGIVTHEDASLASMD